MCSMGVDRIARICEAIEELAGTGFDGVAGVGEPTAGDDAADRLTAIWAMIAEADPELARRLPGYLSAAD
jgi:hypothetical protein